MKAFLQNHTLPYLRLKLVLAYLFVVLDILLTLSLLKTGYFIEANPLMKNIVQSSFYSILVKVILPALLLIYLGIRLRTASTKQLRISNYFINGLNFFYGAVVSLQVIYCIILLVI